MKAVVYTRFGPPEVLKVCETETPSPRDDEVLVQIYATTVTAAEAAMRRGRPLWGRVVLGVVRPRKRMQTLGIELAGEITAVGKHVSRFCVGDEVSDSPVLTSARMPNSYACEKRHPCALNR